MKRLLENMFCSDAPSDVVIVSGVSVLLTAIERRFCRYMHMLESHTTRINMHVHVHLHV